MTYSPEIADVIYPPLTKLAEVTVGQVVDNPLPFLSTVFGARMASNTHLAAKGFVQSSPLVNFTILGTGVDDVGLPAGQSYGGTAHPVNSPFDYSFINTRREATADCPTATQPTAATSSPASISPTASRAASSRNCRHARWPRWGNLCIGTSATRTPSRPSRST